MADAIAGGLRLRPSLLSLVDNEANARGCCAARLSKKSIMRIKVAPGW